MKNETVMNVVYENGARVATVEQVNSRSDDCAEIGNLYYRLSDYYRRLEQGITDEEREAIHRDIAEVKEKIDVYIGYLAGYGE